LLKAQRLFAATLRALFVGEREFRLVQHPPYIHPNRMSDLHHGFEGWSDVLAEV
jgi:hypothetical protein